MQGRINLKNITEANVGRDGVEGVDLSLVTSGTVSSFSLAIIRRLLTVILVYIRHLNCEVERN